MLKVCHFKEIKISQNGVKRNYENKMKSNYETPSHNGSENEGTCFYRRFFKEKYSEKKIARLIVEDSIQHPF